MNHILSRVFSLLLLSAALCAQALPSGPYNCVTLRSGGQNGITNISAFAPIMPLRPSAFTAADFAGACGGAPAYEVLPASSWCTSLNADAAARWIATSPFLTPVSALYCQSFQVPGCGVQSASIRFSFCVDDQLGDPAADPNPIGVYLNGQPIPGFGGIGSQVTWVSTTIAPLLVPGTNQLQVYVRDTGASVAGVIYSANICYVGCRSDEVIHLHSGNGNYGGPDASVRVLAGPPNAALATTAANLAAAASGPMAAIVPPLPSWCPFISSDLQAKWLATDPGYGPGSAIYSHPFSIGSCNILSATLSFTFSASSWLGDPGGAPSLGLFVNGNPVPLSAVDGLGGSACSLAVTAAIPPSWLYGNAANALAVYVRDSGLAQNGVLYSATLTVRPCPPLSEVVALHSGNGNVGFGDAAIRCVYGPPAQALSTGTFTAADFNAALTGATASIVSNFSWQPTLIQDPQAKWVSTPVFPLPRSTLFAHPFTVNTCPADIKRAQLTFYYCADDGLGDPTGGGPNPMGLYLNGIPVPFTAGDISTWPGTNVKTITLANVAPYVVSGANVLYVYDRDRLNGISGVMYSMRLTISHCDWNFYGDPCGLNAPNTFLAAAPTIGGSLDYSVRGDAMTDPQPTLCMVVIGLSDQVAAGGFSLPLDLGVFGAPGCQLLASNDVGLFMLTDATGAVDLSFPIPNDPGLEGLPLRFQTLLLDNVSNPLGLSASRGIAVDCRL